MRRTTDFRPFYTVDRGFTLVEMIVSIVIAGILIGLVGMFGRNQIDAYSDITNRVELADTADGTVRRIARDLRTALPNSVRVSGDFVEFVPIRDAGRYRVQPGGVAIPNDALCPVQANDDPLEFGNDASSAFDVLGPAVAIAAGERLVVYNLGQDTSDVYQDAASSNTRAPTTTGAYLCKIAYGGGAFLLASPQARFQIVATPVSYHCDLAAGQLVRRWGYGFIAAQPTDFTSVAHSSAVLADNVTTCNFSYNPAGSLQRDGLVVFRLSLMRNGETVNLLQQIAVDNMP